MDLYSRMVAFFKVLLPLAALAILATLFLLSRGNDPDTAIPFTEKDVADRLRDQQITAPFLSGTAPNGDEIIVTATLARPGGQNTPAEATDVSARITAASFGSTFDWPNDSCPIFFPTVRPRLAGLGYSSARRIDPRLSR